MGSFRAIMAWVALGCAIGIPLAAAAASPLLAWRDSVYIVAGFAGVIALGLLMVQPLLIGGNMPGLSVLSSRRAHWWTGVILVGAVVVHVAGLWLTSPPDVIDALLFVSPTLFSPWGVIAMWAVFATAMLALLRRRLKVRPRTWRIAHLMFAVVIVVGSVVHALLVQGTMEFFSKLALCIAALVATVRVVSDVRRSAKRTLSR